MEDSRKLDVGHVLTLPNGEMEVTAVSYQETEEHGRHHFTYTLAHKEDMDAQRELERQAEEEARLAREEAERVAAEQEA
jgi:hypothetical protein